MPRATTSPPASSRLSPRKLASLLAALPDTWHTASGDRATAACLGAMQFARRHRLECAVFEANATANAPPAQFPFVYIYCEGRHLDLCGHTGQAAVLRAARDRAIPPDAGKGVPPRHDWRDFTCLADAIQDDWAEWFGEPQASHQAALAAQVEQLLHTLAATQGILPPGPPRIKDVTGLESASPTQSTLTPQMLAALIPGLPFDDRLATEALDDKAICFSIAQVAKARGLDCRVVQTTRPSFIPGADFRFIHLECAGQPLDLCGNLGQPAIEAMLKASRIAPSSQRSAPSGPGASPDGMTTRRLTEAEMVEGLSRKERAAFEARVHQVERELVILCDIHQADARLRCTTASPPRSLRRRS